MDILLDGSKSPVINRKNRNITIDIIKSLGIICMVAGHCGFPFTLFIYLFHMAVFFIASGYCFKDTNTTDFKSVVGFIKRRVTSLYFPYVLWTIIYSILHNFFIRINVYTDNPLLLEYVSGAYINTTNHWSLMDIVFNCVGAIFLYGETQLGGAFWFLTTLFKISVVYSLIDYAIKKRVKMDLKMTTIVQWIISFIFLFIGYFCYITGHSFTGIPKVLSYYILFHIGYIIKRNGWIEKNRTEISHILFLIGTFIILIVCNNLGAIDLSSNNYVNPLFFLVVSLAGWQFLSELAHIIVKTRWLKNIIITIGQNTLAIVILHFLSFKIVNYAGVLLNHQPLCLVAAFPVLYSDGAWWLAYLIVGISVPVSLSLIWKRIKCDIKKRYKF